MHVFDIIQFYSVYCLVALDARLEVGLEQQAELMLKMMSTLEADSILQALTNTSPTCNYMLSNNSLHMITI